MALALLMSLLVIMALTVLCARPAKSEDGKVVVTVRDFSKGMTPVMPPYVNDPEAIVLSQNMYSTQPGSRQLRFGSTEIIDYDSIKLDVTAKIDALGEFRPKHDSASLIFAANDRWYHTFWGWNFSGWRFIHVNWSERVKEIKPFPSGVINMASGNDTVTGQSGARWVRDLAPGDAITVGGHTDTVKYVVGDTKALLINGADTTAVSAAYWCSSRRSRCCSC